MIFHQNPRPCFAGRGLCVYALFLGLYLGFTFLLAAAAVLALQQLSQGADNTVRYAILLVGNNHAAQAQAAGGKLIFPLFQQGGKGSGESGDTEVIDFDALLREGGFDPDTRLTWSHDTLFY